MSVRFSTQPQARNSRFFSKMSLLHYEKSEQIILGFEPRVLEHAVTKSTLENKPPFISPLAPSYHSSVPRESPSLSLSNVASCNRGRAFDPIFNRLSGTHCQRSVRHCETMLSYRARKHTLGEWIVFLEIGRCTELTCVVSLRDYVGLGLVRM